MSQNDKCLLTVIIPTYNEELNIEDCIGSLDGINCKIYVVDSFSPDKTKLLAEELGATVVQGEWKSFSEKINWSISNLNINTEWVMRLDADEILSDRFKEFLIKGQLKKISADGIAIRRRLFFMNQLFSYGGLGSLWDIRLWKHGFGVMENRLLDEHIIIDGRLQRLKLDIIDRNRKSITEWIDKHNRYATSEASSYLVSKQIEGTSESSGKLKRFLKNKIYYKTPLFIRPFIYFIFRYFFLFGFLDGKAGLIFHVLHSFWYRFLVDVKIYEKSIK